VLFLSTAGAKLRVSALLIILVIRGLTRATFPIMRGSSTPKRTKTASDNRKSTHPLVLADELGRVTTGYQHWLTRQPLSVNTRRAYLWAGHSHVMWF
jgi:hypothetical protein